MEDKTFVSYTRGDGDFALRLARDLRAAGLSVWIDQVDIPPGEPWDAAVEDALRRCRNMIVVLSPRAAASRSVMDEVSFALDEGKRVLPVICAPGDVPFRLRRLQHVDCAADYPAGVARIIEALGGAVALTAADAPGVSEDRRARPSESKWQSRLDGSSPAIDRESPSRIHNVRLRGALRMATVAGGVDILACVVVLLNDPRWQSIGSQLLTFLVVCALVAVVLWSAAGAVAAGERVPVLAALGSAVGVLVIWVVVFGTYQDVLLTALAVGAPLAAIVGAVFGRWISKPRRLRP